MFYSCWMINMTNSKHLVQPMSLDQRVQRYNQNNILFELVVTLEIDYTGLRMLLMDCFHVALTKSHYPKWTASWTVKLVVVFLSSKFPFLHTVEFCLFFWIHRL